MKREKLILAVLIMGTMCTMIVSCGNNNSNKSSTPQLTNDETTMLIESVEWDTPSKTENTAELDTNNNTDTPQSVRIGNPELVKYENISVHKDFSYACYPLSDIIDDTKTFSFDFDNDGTSESVVIMYSPTRLKVLSNSKKTGSVIMDFEESVLEDLELEYIQVSAYDFDDDGTFEMILSVRSAFVESIHEIFRYSHKDICFNVVGVVEGQMHIELNGNEIDAPYGGQGLLDIYEYKNGKIIEIQ